ncbi:hypothetical protein ACWGLF_41285 [Streptomyces puniciscabiei]
MPARGHAAAFSRAREPGNRSPGTDLGDPLRSDRGRFVDAVSWGRDDHRGGDRDHRGGDRDYRGENRY